VAILYAAGFQLKYSWTSGGNTIQFTYNIQQEVIPFNSHITFNS